MASGSGKEKELPPVYEERPVLLTPPPPECCRYACISLNSTDKLRLIAFPAETIALVRTIIQNSWARGIQRDSDYYGAHEFKLAGNPWHGQVRDAVRSRTLVLALLRDLYHAGWHLAAATDIMKKVTDKDTLFFTSGPAPPPSSFFAVSFNEGDKMRLIEAAEPEIIAVRNVLGPWVQREEWKVPDVAYQF